MPVTFNTGIDNAGGGFNAQAGRFFQVRWNGLVLGGCQSIQYSETTGVSSWIGEIGSDYKEPDFTMRMVSGTIERLALNKRKLRDLIYGGGASNDSSNGNIDFRQFQFVITLAYNEQFQTINGKSGTSASPSTPIVNTTSAPGPYYEILNRVMFQNISSNLSNPQTLYHESVSFMGYSSGVLADAEHILQAL